MGMGGLGLFMGILNGKQTFNGQRIGLLKGGTCPWNNEVTASFLCVWPQLNRIQNTLIQERVK